MAWTIPSKSSQTMPPSEVTGHMEVGVDLPLSSTTLFPFIVPDGDILLPNDDKAAVLAVKADLGIWHWPLLKSTSPYVILTLELWHWFWLPLEDCGNRMMLCNFNTHHPSWFSRSEQAMIGEWIERKHLWSDQQFAAGDCKSWFSYSPHSQCQSSLPTATLLSKHSSLMWGSPPTPTLGLICTFW